MQREDEDKGGGDGRMWRGEGSSPVVIDEMEEDPVAGSFESGILFLLDF